MHIPEPIVLREEPGRYVPSEQMIKKIRATFKDLASFNEHEFNSLCTTFAYMKDADGHEHLHLPCIEAGVVKTHFDENSYLLFYWNHTLCIGLNALSVKYVGHINKVVMRENGSHFYCISEVSF